MKKFLIYCLALACVCGLIAGCKSSEQDPSVGSSSTTTSTAPTSKLPEYKPGSIILEPQDMDDYDFERKYRITYYRIWSEFEDLLSKDEKEDIGPWLESLFVSTNYCETAEEMLLVSFIKRYNITREEFDAAVELFIANNAGADFNCEEMEIPNGDIIYTFDNEIINNYYRYA